MSMTVDQFGKTVVASRLLSAEELKTFWAALPPNSRPKSGEAFASLLTERNLLTPFQTAEILSGGKTPLVLGDYVLLAKIGAGGMGQVFKARHRHMKRQAAIKLLPPALTKDEAAVKRFQREVEAAAKLSHPNIVQTYDAGVQRGVWYLVMEYVEGHDLSAVVSREGPLPIARAVDIIRQAAKGLAFAHENGVVHRDIKPANLLLDKKGTVKILDMGLARFDDGIAAQDGLTQSGMVMGTIDYMAPEQAFDTRHADARADIYSLGCTLFRLLTNRNLYDGETMVQKLMAHQHNPLPSLAAFFPLHPGQGNEDDDPNRGLISQIVPIFERMVAKRPADRYQSMQEVEAALEALPIVRRSSLSVTIAVGGEGSATKQPAAPFPNVATISSAAPVLPVPNGNLPTVSLHSPLQSTDPVSERSIQVARQNTPQPRGTRLNKLLLAAGCGGLVLVALAVWLIMGDKDVTRGEVPKNGTATITDDVVRTVPPLAKAPFDAKQAKAHQEAWAKHLGTQVETTNSVGMQMALIPPGEFMMGSSDEDVVLALKTAEETKLDPEGVQRIQDERPQHLVRITKPFRLGIHEVTIGQFGRFIEQSGYKTQAEEFGGNSNATKADDPRVTPESKMLNWRTPGLEVGENSPVTQVSWNDAVAFCNWLSEQEKLEPSYVRDGASWSLVSHPQGYRLPTEAEWEYSCRAGTATQFWFGDDWKEHVKFGWSNTNAGGLPRGVGLLPANPFGLYDMHGNVWEWCHDWYDGKWYAKSPSDDPRCPLGASDLVFRGGCWNGTPAASRSSSRSSSGIPARRVNDHGFRVALSGDAIHAAAKSHPVPAVVPPVTKPTAIAPPVAKAPFDAAQAKVHQEAWAKHLGTQVETINRVGAKMILIPPGDFMMGSSDEDIARALKIAEETTLDAGIDELIQMERPQHFVRITKPFRLGMHEVTIGQFRKFIEQSAYKTQAEEFGGNSDITNADDPRVTLESKQINWRKPGIEISENSPVVQVSWNDAVAFCNWLSKEEKLEPSYVRDGGSWALVAQPQGYRLPTEAEWEYACRAGTTTPYSFGDDWKDLDKFGWSQKNAEGRPGSVGLLSANPFGLHDMHGNVWEWCHDWYDASWYAQSPSDDPTGPLGALSRVYRGGGWNAPPADCRSSYRFNLSTPAYRDYHRGFRIALSGDAVPSIAPSQAEPTK